MVDMMQSQGQQPTRNITTMSASAIKAVDGSAPFIANLEHNSRAELSRRRGTSLFDTIKPPSGFSFVRCEASDSTNIILKDATNTRLNVDIACVLYTVEDSKGLKSYRIHISSANTKLIVTQYEPEIEATNIDTFGIQTISDGSTNKFFLYTNQLKNVTSASRFPVMQVNLDNFTPTGFTVSSISEPAFTSNSAVAVTPNRSIAIGINRTFIGELNILYYSSGSASPDAGKSLSTITAFRNSDVILKVVEFDNAVFVITSRAVYRGIFENSVFNFTRISDNIYAYGRGILVVTNFCYIPTIDGIIYKLNMKDIRLKSDSYSSTIGSQVSPIIKHSQPIDSHFDTFNNTLNFTYRHNLVAVNEIYSRSSISSDSSRSNIENDIETIVLSTHNGGNIENTETWTSSIFNYDICGVECVVQLTDGASNFSDHAEALVSSERELVNRYHNSFQESLSTPLIVCRYLPKIFKMSYLYRLDDNVAFPVIVGAPLPSFEALLDQGKFMSTSNIQVAITTDSKQNFSLYNTSRFSAEESLLRVWPAVLTGDLSEPPVFSNDYSKSYHFMKSAVSIINCKVNTSAINGVLFLYFDSSNFRSFLHYKVDF